MLRNCESSDGASTAIFWNAVAATAATIVTGSGSQSSRCRSIAIKMAIANDVILLRIFSLEREAVSTRTYCSPSSSSSSTSVATRMIQRRLVLNTAAAAAAAAVTVFNKTVITISTCS